MNKKIYRIVDERALMEAQIHRAPGDASTQQQVNLFIDALVEGVLRDLSILDAEDNEEEQ